MNSKEAEALKRIKESLAEFPDNRMAQQIFSEDLQLLVKLVEKMTLKEKERTTWVN